MSDRTSFTSRVRLFLDGVATNMYRMVVSPPSDEVALRRRVRRRIKDLGRRYVDGNSDLLGYTYHPIPFPEFANIRSHRHSCEDRLKLIMNELQITPDDWILDVGANVGYFSFGLEREGAKVDAFESDTNTFEIGAALSKLYDRRVLYINKALCHASLQLLRPRYRAILLLSVFHWIVKQDGEEKAVEVLRDLARRADHIFFEAPCAKHDAMYKHRWFSSPEACSEFLKSTLPLAQVTVLGTDPEWMGRVLYKIDCEAVGV